jgi:hypothetical protein
MIDDTEVEIEIEFEDLDEKKEEEGVSERNVTKVELEHDSEIEDKEEKFTILPKITRKIEELDGDTIRVCPTLHLFNKRIKLKCKHVRKKTKDE